MSAAPRALRLFALEGLPEIKLGDPLAALVLDALKANDLALEAGDVLVLAQKVVSKAEGRLVDLASIEPRPEAIRLAKICEKEPELIELVLRESTAVLRCKPGVIIVRHRLGFVLANAGIDRSNVEGAASHALLLPEDPDRSARALRDALRAATGQEIAVLINDSFGRAWRLGTSGVCIGCAGLEPMQDLRGVPDRFGRPLQVTELGLGDEIAAAASLLMGQAGEGRPVVLMKGLPAGLMKGDGTARRLVRPEAEDLFQ